jgi:acyl-CoA dehydrogenase
MDFEYTDKVKDLQKRLIAFMDEHVYPAEAVFEHEMDGFRKAGNAWQPTKIVEDLKKKAKAADLWNLFLPPSAGGETRRTDKYGAGLTNLEYAPLCEIMGRSHLGPEPFNCSAPDTVNMETIVRYGTPEHHKKWLEPLLEGEIRSAFAMTEPDVASSDATNIEASIQRDGDHYVINGRKWWTSGANDPRCKVLIFMGKTDPTHQNRHQQQSMVLVPMDAPGVKVLRHLPVFGYDDAPHGHAEMLFENVRVPVTNILLGEGRGFEIAQGRLGPGRIHHCMRLIGRAERALEQMCQRALSRVAFGKKVADQGVTRERIANARMLIDQARFLVLHAAYKMDKVGNKHAKQEIAMIKVVAPNMACQVIDWAMQVHGGGAVSDDFGLAHAYASSRTLRFADGPDEVHRNAIAKDELAKHLTRG